MDSQRKIDQQALKEIRLPVKLICTKWDIDSTELYDIVDSSGRIVLSIFYENEQGKKDGELLVQLINSTNL